MSNIQGGRGDGDPHPHPHGGGDGVGMSFSQVGIPATSILLVEFSYEFLLQCLTFKAFS